MRVVIGCVGHWVHLWRGLFTALCDRGDVDLHVLTCGAAPGDWRLCQEAMEGRPNLSIVNLPAYLSRLGHMAAWTYPFGEVGRRVAATAPDIIYSIGEISYISTFQLARARERHAPRARLFVYGAQNISRKYPLPFSALEQYTVRRLDHLFPVGSDAEQVVRDKGYQGPATHMPLGVDETLFARTGDVSEARRRWGLEGFVVGYVGRLTPVKCVDLLLQAVAQMGGDAKALIIGHGPQEQALRALAAELGVTQNVQFVGSVPQTELPLLYSCMNAFVLPSREVEYSQREYGLGISPVRIGLKEQFGRVLVEAMACQVPVVGSTSGEIPTVIGDAGLVFREGDADDLARCLNEYRESPGLRAEKAQAGRERALAHYTWRVIADRMAGVWSDSLA